MKIELCALQIVLEKVITQRNANAEGKQFLKILLSTMTALTTISVVVPVNRVSDISDMIGGRVDKEHP